MESNIVTFLAIWGAIGSSIMIGWSLYRDLSDRGELKVHCYIGQVVGGSVSSDIDLLVYNVTNTGKRPIMVTNIGGRLLGKKEFLITTASLPRMLSPGEYILEYSDDLSYLNKDLLSLWACDSLNKNWKCSRKKLKKLKKHNIQN